MGNSYATTTVTLAEISPCRIKLGGVDLGGTEGMTKVIGTFKKAPIKFDQTGDTIMDRVVSGMEIKIETILSQVKDKATWKAVYAHAKLISAGNKAVYFDDRVGDRDSDIALEMILHPLSALDATLDFDHKFYKVVPDEVSEIDFGPSKQQGLKVSFLVLPDTSVYPNKFWFHGDPANGLVAASLGSPSYSGTGNGAMSAVAAASGTITETITVKCVGSTGTNQSNWTVTGSVSGVFGAFSISGSGGHADFTSSRLTFTLTDGTTDFIIGDTFTIAATGANYA